MEDLRVIQLYMKKFYEICLWVIDFNVFERFKKFKYRFNNKMIFFIKYIVLFRILFV